MVPIGVTNEAEEGGSQGMEEGLRNMFLEMSV
jgi:hypothetical protein